MDKYRQTFEAYNALATLYAEKFADVTLYAKTIDRFLQEMPMYAPIFEPGCGPGNCTHYILHQRNDLEIFATDMAPNMLEIAQGNNPSAVFKQLDCRDISMINDTFQGIFCSFVIPYLHKEDNVEMMRNFHQLLSPNGCLYISFIAGEYSDSKYQWSSDGSHQTFVHYYTETFFHEVLSNLGFVHIESFSVAYPREMATEKHIAMIYCKA